MLYVMLEAALIPPKTVITAKGDGPVVDINDSETRIFLVTLEISKVVEQESFELSIAGSVDGQNWGPKPLFTFPQQFYASKTPMLLDLSAHAEVKSIRAQWEVNRWGRGPEAPSFEVGASLREVPASILQESRR